MSSIVNDMIADKLDQVIFLLKAQNTTVITEEKWQALEQSVATIRQTQLSQQLQPKNGNQDTAAIQLAISQLKQHIDDIPTKITVTHKHHLHKAIWVSVSLLLTSILFGWLWISQLKHYSQFRDNDLKYRYFKATGNRRVQELCNWTDSLFKSDKEAFRTGVVSAEKHLLELADSIRLARERRRSVKLTGRD